MSAVLAETQAGASLGAPVYELNRVNKTYARNLVVALQDVDMTLREGNFTSVIGSSDCGKSTLLKIMAGLTPPTKGRVVLQGEPVTGPHRDIGMMFQQATLFPWKTVVENIVLPIEIRDGKPAAKAAMTKAFELLEIVGLKGFENVYLNEFSGGMAQRASICRMLITEPAVLLEEPFSALDELSRDLLASQKADELEDTVWVQEVAFAPLFAAWLSFGIETKVALAAIIATFPIVVGSAAGLHAADENARMLFKTMGANRMQTLIKMKLPSGLPQIFTGLKIEAVGVMVGAITGEFLGGGQGFGELIRVAASQLNTPRVFSLILYLSLVGLTLYLLVQFTQRKVVFWHKENVGSYHG